MLHDIEATYDQLMLGASDAAKTYMIDAKRAVEDIFGSGYANKNPEMVIAFMTAASADFKCAMLKLVAQDLRNGLMALAESDQR